MFQIEGVHLSNFRSFKGDHEFSFPTSPGLYCLTSENLDNPRLGRNGCGKSTLLDAIVWCIYGRTSRGLKASDIVTWGETSCHVVLRLNVAGTILGIARYQNPNSLAVNGKTVEQVDIGLSQEAFLHSVLMPQFGESFFDLSPAAKLTLFSQIMELDFWLERSQDADVLAKDLATVIQNYEKALAKIGGQIETVKADIQALIGKADAFESEQKASVQGLEKDLRQLTHGIEAGENGIKGVRAALSRAEAKLTALVGKSTCPTCKQKIPSDDLTSLTRNKSDFEAELRKLQNQQARGQQEMEHLQAKIAQEEQRINPYAQMAQDKQDTQTGLKQKWLDTKAKVARVAEEHTAVSYWVTGFKRVRLFIVEGALRQLEVEVNNNLTGLGLTGWRIEFDVERENKSGGITKGFVVLIHAPGHSEPVKWESWSGGETQRLRLAGNLGLANLIMERAGLANTIEFYDEASSHLSEEGINDVLETLHARAHTLQRQIWVIDHNSLDFGDFSGVLLVTKDSKGSHVQYE